MIDVMSLLNCQKEFALHFFFFIAVEADALLLSCKFAPGYQAFVTVNIEDLICKMCALFKHVAHS